MSRFKILFAGLLLTSIAGLVPTAEGQATASFKVLIAGSSAMWQTMALGAYNSGVANTTIGSVAPIKHWTSASNKINLNDTRPSGGAKNDPGTIWVVWDSHKNSAGQFARNVWAFIKVDSVVGNRCFFANPRCNISAVTGDVNTSGAGQIGLTGAVWGADTQMPPEVQGLLTSGAQQISVAATDIRPEDALFATCRVNSDAGASVLGTGHGSDNLDGLGFNTNNPSGQCPAATDDAHNVGSDILSGVTTIISTATAAAKANVVSFNITGTDPMTGNAIPGFTVFNVGAAPIVFIYSRSGGSPMDGITNATELELQKVFSGTTCNSSAFASHSATGDLNVFLREPLSGTMNTTEATVFRRPTTYPNLPGVLGVSQENNMGTQTSDACAGTGKRYRTIGTGEEVNSVKLSNTAAGFTTNQDGIGYTFFSYGNVSGIGNNATYRYMQLDGYDPIWQTYGSTLDPGETGGSGTPGLLPTNTFPKTEAALWAGKFSFPNLRNGLYRAWSVLRLVGQTGTTSATNAKNLVTVSNKYVTTTVPDYVPFAAVTGTTDLGLKLVRSHYQQRDGNGTIGAAPSNVTAEAGGDVGGQILPTLSGITTRDQKSLIQSASADGAVQSNLGPVVRP